MTAAQYPAVGITHADLWATKDGLHWEHCPTGSVTISAGGYIAGWTVTSAREARDVMRRNLPLRVGGGYPAAGITGPGWWLALAWPEYRQVSSEELNALIKSGTTVRAWGVHAPADASEFMWSDFNRAMKDGAS